MFSCPTNFGIPQTPYVVINNSQVGSLGVVDFDLFSVENNGFIREMAIKIEGLDTRALHTPCAANSAVVQCDQNADLRRLCHTAL